MFQAKEKSGNVQWGLLGFKVFDFLFKIWEWNKPNT
jgi:hypothetical protein